MSSKILLLLYVLSFNYDSLSNEIGNKTIDYSFGEIAKLEMEELLLIEEKNKSMPKDSNKDICLLYLQKYAEKDIYSMEKMFSDDIVLRDWKIHVIGKKNALRETRKNFQSANSIEIEVLSTYENENTVAAELKITVNSTEELYVVDVITINSDSKIKSIRAYLGRGDN